MEAILECVPNFSEGRDPAVIEAIVAALDSQSGAAVLHVDPNASANRTVVTLAGAPRAVCEAMFRGIQVAAQRIDMRRHTGTHPRIGATDVVPLVPVRGITLAEAAWMANELGQRVGQELGVPVYLYEAAATRETRRSLAAIRFGEYEKLPQRMTQADWVPDFGPTDFQPQVGATVIGARNFLLAYNVNLQSKDEALAKQIASQIREKAGENPPLPTRMKDVRAIGWYIDEFGMAQVSLNLLNFRVNGFHQAFEQVRKLAQKAGTDTAGSELVGLTPLEPLLMAGEFYANQYGLDTRTEISLVKLAVMRLGLNKLAPFDPNQRVLEYALRGKGFAA
jgi:glutamate formiminotransferase/formiminotetrahydrofolate cyclodeaminase